MRDYAPSPFVQGIDCAPLEAVKNIDKSHDTVNQLVLCLFVRLVTLVTNGAHHGIQTFRWDVFPFLEVVRCVVVGDIPTVHCVLCCLDIMINNCGCNGSFAFESCQPHWGLPRTL